MQSGKLKIILDTNVIVSGLISDAIPSKILSEIVLSEKVEFCLSEEVFQEYFEVLKREKFSKFYGFKVRAEIVLSRLKDIAVFYRPVNKINLLSDKSDNKFLELAEVSSANYLITGNSTDFILEEFENTIITTPRIFWEEYISGH